MAVVPSHFTLTSRKKDFNSMKNKITGEKFCGQIVDVMINEIK